MDYLAKPEVNGWQLLKSIHPETGSKAHALKQRKLKSGTIVILEILDRVLIKSDESKSAAEKHWASEVSRTREHLEMVFIDSYPQKKRERSKSLLTKILLWHGILSALMQKQPKEKQRTPMKILGESKCSRLHIASSGQIRSH